MSEIAVERVNGLDLKVGDVLCDLWWIPGSLKCDRIIGLEPYTGPLKHLFPGGASIAEFAIREIKMTIDHSDRYKRVKGEGFHRLAEGGTNV